MKQMIKNTKICRKEEKQSAKFEAVIKKHPQKDAAYIEMPFDVEAVFGAKRVKVVAKFDGVEYRGSIVKMGLPCYKKRSTHIF